MRTLILVCGEGLGHTSRCIAVARELVAAGHVVHFGAYGYSQELIERKGYMVSTIPSEITLVGEAGELDLKASIFETMKKADLGIFCSLKISSEASSLMLCYLIAILLGSWLQNLCIYHLISC